MSLANLKCDKPECSARAAFDSANGYKRHMTMTHGGWRESDPGVKTGSDVARTLAGGHGSSRDVASAAPETDQPESQAEGAKGTRTRRSISQEEKEKAEKRRIASQRIGKILSAKAARGPYIAAAALMNDERWMLNKQEEEELTDATLQIIEAYDFDMSRPIFAILALLAAHSDCIAARLPLLNATAEETKQETRPN